MSRRPANSPPVRSACGDPNQEDYSADELEFFKAMDRYKRESRRPFPTCREVLAVLKALGYRKETAA